MTASTTDDLASAERRIQELTKELAQFRGELTEAREQQAATAETLRVISSSPMDLKGVFEEIALSAARLCDAHDASIFQVDGDHLRLVNHHGPIPALPVGDDTLPLTRGLATGRAVLDRRTIHVADMQAEADEYPESHARSIGFRTILAVPLVGTSEVIGAIGIRRIEAKLFSDKQIALLETFATQTVIAIENTRLFEAEQASKRELQESLEYQTATSEVLNVISRSPSNLQPVLDVIVETAVRLCEADFADFRLLRDGTYYVAATTTGNGAPDKKHIPGPIAPGRGSVTGRVALERRIVHVPDVLADSEYTFVPRPNFPALRSILGVPLLRDGGVIGVIVLFNHVVRPFTQRQIGLVSTFADQAVIAIENTRLFEEVQARTKELQESLDRQTATSEVLGVISRSSNEVQPVFDAIVATAHRLCKAERAAIWRLEGETFRAVAHCGLPEERVESVFSARRPVSRGNMLGRATLARRAVQVEDVATDPELVAAAHAFMRAGNIHTVLAVPLLLKGRPIGVISLTRTRVARFDDKQVALVESFADQAVIAIE